MRTALGGLWFEITIGLAAGVGFSLLMAASYYSQRQRLCPEGWATCDPFSVKELAEYWAELTLLAPLFAIPLALAVGGTALLVIWLGGYVIGKLRI